MESATWIKIVEFAFGFFGLILGLWHLIEMRPQVKKLSQLSVSAERHLSTLKLVQRELTTQPIGQFPKYLEPIAEMLEHAKREITILCDFPAYGSFSAHHDFIAYRQVIERKIDKGLDVKIMCLDLPSRNKLFHEQFSEEEKNWETWRAKPEINKRIEVILRSHGMDRPADDITFDQFAALLEKDNQRMLNETFVQTKPEEINAHIPIYFWIIDDNSAIFAIPSYSKRAVEHGFQTLDRNLIIGFKDLMARYQNLQGNSSVTDGAQSS